MTAKTSRFSFDAIMADACPDQPRSETVAKIGLHCIAVRGLMQADAEAAKRKARKAVVAAVVEKAKPKRQKATGKRKAKS